MTYGHGAYHEVSPATITPTGWIGQWLDMQKEGLTGKHQNCGYPYDTDLWIGQPPSSPTGHGSDWWPFEQTGYVLDAMARLELLSPGDEKIATEVKANLDYLLENSTEDRIGQCDHLWSIAVIARMLFAKYLATKDECWIEPLRKLYSTRMDAIVEGERAGVNMEIAGLIYQHTGDAKMLEIVEKTYPAFKDFEIKGHGVTICESLKSLPTMYLCTGDTDALERAKAKYEELHEKYSLCDGVPVSTEGVSTPTYASAHEACDITDYTWSLGYMLMATGDMKYADRIEWACFNALPSAVTKDFKAAQYYSLPNIAISTAESNHSTWFSPRMSYRAGHDTECCVGNVSRCMPNYGCRMYMATNDGGIAALLYGASTFETSRFTVTQETDYPFSDEIRFTFAMDEPVVFPFHLRIPGWCEGASVTVNGEQVEVSGSLVRIEREFRDGDVVVLTLPMGLRIHEYPHKAFKGSRYFTYGPLVLSMPIEANERAYFEETDEIKEQLQGKLPKEFPAYELKPSSEWRYAIDADTVLKRAEQIPSPVPVNPWLADTTPIRFRIPASQITDGWDLEHVEQEKLGRKVLATPQSLPDHVSYASDEEIIHLIPLGATLLRITNLPVVP